MVKNLPDDAEDKGSNPGRGRSHPIVFDKCMEYIHHPSTIQNSSLTSQLLHESFCDSFLPLPQSLAIIDLISVSVILYGLDFLPCG